MSLSSKILLAIAVVGLALTAEAGSRRRYRVRVRKGRIRRVGEGFLHLREMRRPSRKIRRIGEGDIRSFRKPNRRIRRLEDDRRETERILAAMRAARMRKQVRRKTVRKGGRKCRVIMPF